MIQISGGKKVLPGGISNFSILTKISVFLFNKGFYRHYFSTILILFLSCSTFQIGLYQKKKKRLEIPVPKNRALDVHSSTFNDDV